MEREISERLEYSDGEECMLRLTEIQSILENDLYEDDQEMQALMKEQEYLEKWKSENAPDFQW